VVSFDCFTPCLVQILASLRTGIRATMVEFAAALAVEAPASADGAEDAAFTGLVRAVAASVEDVAQRAQLVMQNGMRPTLL
jgi:hypothetical protein